MTQNCVASVTKVRIGISSKLQMMANEDFEIIIILKNVILLVTFFITTCFLKFRIMCKLHNHMKNYRFQDEVAEVLWSDWP